MGAISYVDQQAKKKKWVRDMTDWGLKRLAVIGANGTAKTTYSFRMFARLAWRRPGMFLITSGTTDQVGKLFDQKLRSIMNAMGLVKSDNVKKIYELANGTKIHMKSRENYKTAEGIEYDYWFADEFHDHSVESAEMFKKRTRKSRENSLFRITGLSDDPDHWQYDFFDRNNIKLHELSIHDHPSQDWIDYYKPELESLYPAGPKRDRYVYGMRKSITGINLFNIKNDHKQPVEYDPEKDLYFCWDFNVIYRAVTVWQIQGKNENGVPVLGCIASYQMNEATTYEDAQKLAAMWAKHKNRVFLHGDASGDNRTASTSETMWQQVQKAFKEQFSHQLRYIVPRSNPPVKDTIQCLNWALTNDLIFFDPSAAKAFRSVSAVKADRYGEIDKKMDDSPDGANTHEADTVRYMSWHILHRHMPGAKSKKIHKIKMGGF